MRAEKEKEDKEPKQQQNVRNPRSPLKDYFSGGGRPLPTFRSFFFLHKKGCVNTKYTAAMMDLPAEHTTKPPSNLTRPPLEPPMMASCSFVVYPSAARYLAAAVKSSNTFCLLPSVPPECHSSPYSPPPLAKIAERREKEEDATEHEKAISIERGETSKLQTWTIYAIMATK